MRIGNRKGERGSLFHDPFFRESPTPSEMDFKFFQGSKPGSLGQNAVAEPLAPPPLIVYWYKFINFIKDRIFVVFLRPNASQPISKQVNGGRVPGTPRLPI